MAKSRGAAWAVWLQAVKLTVCTRSIQSNTQLSQQAKFPGAHGTYVRSRGDLMYLLILRRSQSSPFSLLYSTLWRPQDCPWFANCVSSPWSLQILPPPLPRGALPLGWVPEDRGRVCLVFHFLPQLILYSQRGICGWTGISQTMFIQGVFETLYACVESENSKSGVQSSFHGWKIHFRSQVEAITVTKFSEPS